LKFKKIDFETNEYKNIFNIKLVDDKDSEKFVKISTNENTSKACTRFMGVKIKNIVVMQREMLEKWLYMLVLI
jgi:hypothetical protein